MGQEREDGSGHGGDGSQSVHPGRGAVKPGGTMECGFIPWHSPSVLVWEGAGWSSPAPVDGSAASHGRTGQGRWIKTAAAKGEERRELASLHTVN